VKFPYAPYRVVPTEAAPERTVLYRPVIRVRFHGPSTSCQVRALLDTGADESYLSENIAQELGLTALSDTLAEIQSASGEMFAWYAALSLEITDGTENHRFPITVGVVPQEWSEMILGHVGFFEHFDANFSDTDRIITLTARTG
jgi:predicted aspartyl protease